MENKLILVEGIPGAGKTTTARIIKERLISEGKNVILYEEGMSHPADMAWKWMIFTKL
ncbi:zeta toxin family protein [Clostridium sp. UBA4548]|uniref:zeta toxin family protein n=1 Tax=Clostridium sp. UBA4548 TaxID=1946361 RepID=UPI0025C41708|nr:zeta toxin family protein [Clostridium sp. UBA4548]